MKAILDDYRLIWRYAVGYQESGISRTIRWAFLVAVMVLGIIVGASSKNGSVTIIFGIGCPIIVIGVGSWFKLLGWGAMLRSSTYVNLAPRIRVRTIQITQLTWFAITVSASLLIWTRFGSYWWTFLWFGGAFLGMALMILRQIRLWMILSLYLFFLCRNSLPQGLRELLASDIALVIYLPLLIWASYHFIQVAFPRGGERQLVVNRWVKRIVAGMVAAFLALSGRQYASRIYASVLRRDCAMRSPPANLIMQSLGPGWHALRTADWFFLLSGVLVFIVVLFKLFKLWVGADTGYSEGRMDLVSLIILSPFIPVQVYRLTQYVDRISETVPEQALFRLSPLIYSLRHFNLHLAKGAIHNCLFEWLFCTCVIMVVSTMLGASATALMAQIFLCSLSLPFIGAILVDHSADGRKQCHVAMGWIGLCVFVLSAVFLDLYFMTPSIAPNKAAWLIGFTLTNITFAIAIIVVRWRAMIAAPIAFPAGRMKV